MRFFLLLFLSFSFAKAQEKTEEYNPIVTSASFLSIAPDARSTGMANLGVSTSPDIFSQHHNPSKYIFMEKESAFGFSVTPWLGELVDDMYLFYGVYFFKINKISSFGSSFRVFKIGDIKFSDSQGNPLWEYKPIELAIDVSYSLLLSNTFSMSVSARYIFSNLTDDRLSPNYKNGNSFSVDISGFYTSNISLIRRYKSIISIGYNISNIGFKMSYDKASQESYFIPTNLSLGSSLKFIFNKNSSLLSSIELFKLLVPSPPIRDNAGKIIKGNDNSKLSVISGILQSFYDAPDGFSEELQEISIGIGLEYSFKKSFFFRGGYYGSSKKKSNIKHINVGFGFSNKSFDIGISYLFSIADDKNPLENTLRLSIGYMF